jgi:hypothetical protein
MFFGISVKNVGFLSKLKKFHLGGGGVPGSNPAAVRSFRKNFNVYIHLSLLLDFWNKKN